MIVLLLALAQAEPIAGLTLRPFSRADLVWVEEDRTSGETVGEFDGVVRPAVQPFAGLWFTPRTGAVASLGIAHQSSTTRVGGDVTRRSHTVVRPEIAFRYALRPASPRVWTDASLYMDLPAASDRSTTYSEDEQDSANDAAANTRARLFGIGGSLGLASEVDLSDLLSVGFAWRVGLHRGNLRSTTAVSSSTWLATDASLLFTFHWPRAESPPPTPASAEDVDPSG